MIKYYRSDYERGYIRRLIKDIGINSSSSSYRSSKIKKKIFIKIKQQRDVIGNNKKIGY